MVSDNSSEIKSERVNLIGYWLRYYVWPIVLFSFGFMNTFVIQIISPDYWGIIFMIAGVLAAVAWTVMRLVL